MRFSEEASLDSPACRLPNLPPGFTLTSLAPREDTEDDVVSSPPSFSEEEAAEGVEEEGYQDFLLPQVTH